MSPEQREKVDWTWAVAWTWPALSVREWKMARDREIKVREAGGSQRGREGEPRKNSRNIRRMSRHGEGSL